MGSELFEFNFQQGIHEYLLNKRDYSQIRPKANISFSPNETNLMFDATPLANSSTPNDWSNSFIYLPLTLKVETDDGDELVDSFQNVFALSLKNGVQNLINNIVIRYNNNMYNQNNSNGANLAITWELLKLTDQQLKLIADSMLFKLDSCDSCAYSGRIVTNDGSGSGDVVSDTTAGGFYEMNNRIGENTTSVNLYDANASNAGAEQIVYSDKLSLGKDGYRVNNGRLQRILNTVNTENSFVSKDNLKSSGVSYVEKSTTFVTYYLTSVIPLSILHDFFKQLGIVMGAKIEIELGLNTGISELTVKDGKYTAVSNNFNKNSVVPFQISPLGRGITPETTTTKLTCKINIGIDNKKLNAYEPILFVKKVLYTEDYNKIFINNSFKTISYMDYYTTTSRSVPSNDNLNNFEIFNSVSRARYLLILPEYVFGTQPSMSPFSSSPVTTAPYAKISNLQVYRSLNALFERPVNYSFEHYQQHLLNIMSKDGGNLKSMEVSGQITKEMFDKCYGYHVINLSYGPSTDVTDAVSQSYSITLTNLSNFTVKYHFILFFERSIDINPTTSEIILKKDE
jgi:hypothetical protein